MTFIKSLGGMIEAAASRPPVRAAVVHPTKAVVMHSLQKALAQHLIEPVLVGPEHKIRAAAEEANLDIRAFRLVATEHSHAAAEAAVKLARDGEVSALIKGDLPTGEIMESVVARQGGIRTDRRLSHIFALEVATYPKLLLITDAAINIQPNLDDKRDIVQNAIDLAHALGIEQPRVAIMSAIEKVNSRLQSTIDAAALCKMADRGQITGGILDGPLAFDNAISAEAAEEKGIHSPVSGQTDIMVVPDLESGNLVAKQLRYLAGARTAGIALGARVPIALNSRSEDAFARYASIALVSLYVSHRQAKARVR